MPPKTASVSSKRYSPLGWRGNARVSGALEAFVHDFAHAEREVGQIVGG